MVAAPIALRAMVHASRARCLQLIMATARWHPDCLRAFAQIYMLHAQDHAETRTHQFHKDRSKGLEL